MATMPPPDRVVAASTLLYRGLLLAYPAKFRREYGGPMAQVFRDCCRDAVLWNGLRGVARLWLMTLLDLARTALVERIAEVAQAPRSQWIRWSGVASILAGALWIVAIPGLGEVLPQVSHAGGHILIAITALLSLLALIGLYARYAGRSGRAGRAGLVVSLLGTVSVTIGNVLEGLWEIEIGWGLFMLGMLAMIPGLLIFSGVALRANILPQWSVWPFLTSGTIMALLFVPLVFGMPVTLGISIPENSVLNLFPLLLLSVFGVGWMALGYLLWSGPREETAPPLAMG